MTKALFSLSLAIVALLSSNQNASADLLMWWSFDEDAGSEEVVDRSGNENAGVLMNFDFTEDSDLQPDAGKFGGAVHFDGEDDYINNTTGFQPTGEAFTYAYFFKPDEDDYTDGHERDDHIYCNARPHFSFSRDGGGDGLLGMYFTMGGDTESKSTTSEWNNDTWYHVAWTYDGEDIRMYVDGVEESALARSGEHSVQGDGRFNLGSNAGGNPFDGYMDDLTVWDEALAEADIAAIAQNGVEAFLDQRNVDSDGDDLPDIWELQIVDANDEDAITTVVEALPDEDFDNDGSSNRNEFNLGTNPVDPDSDDDGLADGAENNSKSWGNAGMTGTDPRNPDSDGDGLSDGVENPDLPYDPANPGTQPGTDPNIADTDKDGWSDGAEIQSETDPTNSNSFPTANQRILFLGAAADEPTAGADQAVMDFLVDRYGEPNVDYMQSNVAQTDDELAYGALILSSTFGSGTARGKFEDSPVPILNWEEALARDADGEFAMSEGRPKDSSDHSIVIKEDHPITAGFDVGSTVVMTEGAAEFWWSTGAQAPGSVSLACDDDDENNLFLTIIEQGGELLNGSPAPGRRIMLGFTDATFDFLTDDGRTLVGQAVDWLLGLAGSGPDFQITEVGLAGNEVTLTWTSRQNKTYTIDRSTNLQNWLELTDGLASEGDLTTFVDDALPEGSTELYYRVREEE